MQKYQKKLASISAWFKRQARVYLIQHMYAEQVSVLWPPWEKLDVYLVLSAPFPEALIISKASSTEQQESKYCSGSVKSLILDPCGQRWINGAPPTIMFKPGEVDILIRTYRVYLKSTHCKHCHV